MALGIVALASVTAELLHELTGSPRLGGPFLVGVLVTSYLVGSGPGYMAAILSFGIYNFSLVNTRLSLASYTPEDVLVLLTFPTVAMLMGNLTGRVRDEAKRAEARALATAVLFEGTREFSVSDDPALIRARLAEHLAAAAQGRAFVLDGEALCSAGGEGPAPMVLSAARALALEDGDEPRTIEAAGWRVRYLTGGGVGRLARRPAAGGRRGEPAADPGRRGRGGDGAGAAGGRQGPTPRPAAAPRTCATRSCRRSATTFAPRWPPCWPRRARCRSSATSSTPRPATT